MKIVKKKVADDGKSLELEVEGEKHTFLTLLRDVLEHDPEVLYASYRLEHPVLSNPTFRVRLHQNAAEDVMTHIIQGAKRIVNLCDELIQLLDENGIKNPSDQ